LKSVKNLLTISTIVLISFSFFCSTASSSSLSSTTTLQNTANFKFFNNFAPTIITPSPVTLALDRMSRIAYALFQEGSSVYLENSTNFVNWTIVNRNFVPPGYGNFAYGMDLAVTNSGTVIVSMTAQIKNDNFTIFRASWNNGQTFSTVLNVSLHSPNVTRSDNMRFDEGAGHGFWHGVAETTNGTLFAGLYNPEGLIYRSSDNAKTWSLVFNASATGFGWQNEIHDVEVNPYTNDVYAITDDEAGAINNRTIWLSTDYGISWHLLWAQDLKTPGSGLSSAYVPLAIGFLQNGTIASLGLDSANTMYMYLFHISSNGSLSEYERLNASSSYTDPFFTNWILPLNSTSLLWATRDSIYSSNRTALGAGLLVASSTGVVTPLAIVQNTKQGEPGDLGFEDVLGPTLNGNYGAIAYTEDGLILLAFNMTTSVSHGSSSLTSTSTTTSNTPIKGLSLVQFVAIFVGLIIASIVILLGFRYVRHKKMLG
jgi:hypothetical protein